MASNLKVDIVKPTATNGSLSLKGDSGGSATANGIVIDSSGNTSITGKVTGATSLDGAVTINESGADVDFRVESDTNANAFFLDGATGNIGIGNSGNSSRKVDIIQDSGQTAGVRVLSDGSGAYYQMFSGTANTKIGTSDGTDQIEFHNGSGEAMRIDSNGDVELTGGGDFTVSGTTTTSTASLDGAVTINESGADVDFRVESDTNANAFFLDGATGNIGIGNSGSSSRKVDIIQDSGQTAGVRVLSDGSGAYYQMFSGTANTKIGTSDGTDQIEFHNGSGEAMRIDSSGNVKFNSGYGSVATVYGCRAWVVFNGNNVTSTADMTGVNGSGNVSSLVDQGPGEYKINFINYMPDTYYAICGNTDGGFSTQAVIASNSEDEEWVEILVRNIDTNVLTDRSYISVAIIR